MLVVQRTTEEDVEAFLQEAKRSTVKVEQALVSSLLCSPPLALQPVCSKPWTHAWLVALLCAQRSSINVDLTETSQAKAAAGSLLRQDAGHEAGGNWSNIVRLYIHAVKKAKLFTVDPLAVEVSASTVH